MTAVLSALDKATCEARLITLVRLPAIVPRAAAVESAIIEIAIIVAIIKVSVIEVACRI